jgi:hypothetical protein
MARRDLARGHRSLDGGVPTQHTRRPRLLTGAAALSVAAAVVAYPAEHEVAVAAAVGGPGLLLILVALLGVWDDGLVAGAGLLLIAYAVSLSVGHLPYDPAAPVLAAALVALVDLGNWSLELRESNESPRFHHLRTLAVLACGGLASGAAVFAAGAARAGGGIALWLVGAAAAAALLVLIRPRRTD